jgi:hypothetical protein
MNRKLFLIVLASIVMTFTIVQQTVTAGQEGWPPPSPGCHYIGNSACGGDDRQQCAPQERHLSQQCDNGRVINSCGVDGYCAKTNKGRVSISGPWRGGQYQIHQTGDTFTISGGGAGPANGHFTGGNVIVVTWPQAHATYTGAISGTGTHGTRIQWDHPAGNVWVR